MKQSMDEHHKLLEHSRLSSEDLNSKYNNAGSGAAPRLTHPPYTFPTYQGTYCLSNYPGGMEPRVVNGVSYPIPVDGSGKGESYGRSSLINNSDLEWRA